MSIRYDVYAGDLLLGSTHNYFEAREWEKTHDKARCNGPLAEIREIDEECGKVIEWEDFE